MERLFLAANSFNTDFVIFYCCIMLLLVTYTYAWFNGIWFAQDIPKELILLCMDYDKAVSLESVES